MEYIYFTIQEAIKNYEKQRTPRAKRKFAKKFFNREAKLMLAEMRRWMVEKGHW